MDITPKVKENLEETFVEWILIAISESQSNICIAIIKTNQLYGMKFLCKRYAPAYCATTILLPLLLDRKSVSDCLQEAVISPDEVLLLLSGTENVSILLTLC